MGIVQKDALRTTIVSYIGMVLGYLNKVYLFLLLLSSEEVGLINLLLYLGVLFAQFSNLGTVNTTWKFFPFLNNPEKKHSGFLTLNILIVFSGALFISLLTLLFRGPITGYFLERSERLVDYYYWIIPLGVAIVTFKLLESYLRALYKNVFPVFANDFVLRVLTTLVLIVYAFKWISFDELVIVICLLQFVPALLVIGYLMKIGEWHVSVKGINIPKRLKKSILTYSMFSYANSLAAVVVVSLDAIMVSAMVGLSAFGVYSIVLYLIRALMIPYTAIARVSSPIVAQNWKDKDMDTLSKLYKQVSSVSLFIALFSFLGVWASGDELFTLLAKSGKEYYAGLYVFLFLMIGRITDMYMGLNGTILVTSKKYKYDILFTLFLIGAVIGLNLVFIPWWGTAGAAIATTIGVIGYNLMRLLFVWYHYGIHPFKWNQVKVIALFVLILATFHFVPFSFGNIWINMIVKSALVTLLFPGTIYLLKLEPEIVAYVDKVLETLKKKIGK